jgi:hypothetical protein
VDGVVSTRNAGQASARPISCRCPVASWRELRYALGLRQSDMAEMLGLTVGSVAELERNGRRGRGHRCPLDMRLERLRDYLSLPEMRARLAASGFPFPYPEA